MMTLEEQRYEDLRAGHPIAHVREWEHHARRQMLDRRMLELSRALGRTSSTRRAR